MNIPIHKLLPLIVGYKDYATVDAWLAAAIKDEDPKEELAHIEDCGPVYKVYPIAEWRNSQERYARQKAASELIRQRTNLHREAVEKVIAAVSKASLLERDAATMMTNTFLSNRAGSEGLISSLLGGDKAELEAFFDRECVSLTIKGVGGV